MPQLADHAQRMPRSGIREVMDLAWSLPGPVIGLHVGEPSFATPEHVLDGARRALDRAETRYVPNAGIPALREAIAGKVAARNGLRARPEQVVVSAGRHAGAATPRSLATTSAGSEVLRPRPRMAELRDGGPAAAGTPRRLPAAPGERLPPGPRGAGGRS